MISLKSAVSPKLRPFLVHRAVQMNGSRSMTVLSKESAEEYKKQVSTVAVQQAQEWRFPPVVMGGYSTMMGRLPFPVRSCASVYRFDISNFESIHLILSPPKQNYTARMNRTGRPVSPHVTIYAFPVAAISSITNRVTGCALSFGAFGLAGLDLVGGSGTSLELMQTIGSQGFLVAAPAKFAVSFPIVYHYFGALRHFSWDYFPDLLNNVDVPKSSWALLGASTAVSAGLMFV